MELPGDVGIFRGIFRHRFHGHVAHGLLAFAFRPDQIGDRLRPVVQDGLGHVVHAVPQVGFQQEVREHGVELRAFHADAVALHHQHVILEVLRHLFDLQVLQHGTEALHNGLCMLLPGGHRDVPSFMCFPAEGEAHQLRILHGEGVGLGVKTEFLQHGQLLSQGRLSFRRVGDSVIVRGGGEVGHGSTSHPPLVSLPSIASLTSFTPEHADLVRMHCRLFACCGRGFHLCIYAQYGLQQTAEFQFAEHLLDLLLVRRIQVQCGMVHLHRCVHQDGGQRLAHPALLREGDHVLLLLALELLHTVDDAFQAAELFHQLHGGLLADAGNAGDVVHRVAHQAEDVAHLIGVLQVPARADLLRPQ